MPRTTSAPTDRLGGRRYLERFYGLSPSTRGRWQQAGIIPPPDRVIASRQYWFESTLRVLGQPSLSSMAPDGTRCHAHAERSGRAGTAGIGAGLWRPTPRCLG